MPIDNRHTQIREGAGLEESRLNVEFIEWLRKWSTPLLIVIAVAACGYVLYHKYHVRRETRANEAFASLETVLSGGNPNPTSLLSVADEYAGVRAVPMMARLEAADLYLSAVRRGVDPGAQVGSDGKVSSDSDLMDEQERTTSLNEAARLYQAVLDECAGKPELAIHAIGATFGLAAVAECRGDMAAARSQYEAVKALAKQAGFSAQEKIADERIAGLDGRAQMPTLYEASALPKMPWIKEPPTDAAPAPAPATVEPSTPPVVEPAAPEPTQQPATTPPTPTGGEPGTPPPK
jgi:hypothetical protein